MLENRELFVKIREMCMDIFLKENRVTKYKGPWKVKLTHRPSWICRFICERLGTGTNTLVIDKVRALQCLCDRWQTFSGDAGTPVPGHKQEYTQREESVNLQMAAYILVAFYKSPVSWTQKLKDQDNL